MAPPPQYNSTPKTFQARITHNAIEPNRNNMIFEPIPHTSLTRQPRIFKNCSINLCISGRSCTSVAESPSRTAVTTCSCSPT